MKVLDALFLVSTESDVGPVIRGGAQRGLDARQIAHVLIEDVRQEPDLGCSLESFIEAEMPDRRGRWPRRAAAGHRRRQPHLHD